MAVNDVSRYYVLRRQGRQAVSGDEVVVACFASGTRLASTDHPDRPSPDTLRDPPNPGKVRPTRIAAQAFGAAPTRDLVLSPDHAIHLDGALIPSARSSTAPRSARCPPHASPSVHVELASHDVLLAEDLAAESYRDTGNRSMFANAPLVELHPRMTTGAGSGLACPIVLDGPRLDRLRAILARPASPRRLGRAS